MTGIRHLFSSTQLQYLTLISVTVVFMMIVITVSDVMVFKHLRSQSKQSPVVSHSHIKLINTLAESFELL